jgi:hypothetical protein
MAEPSVYGPWRQHNTTRVRDICPAFSRFEDGTRFIQELAIESNKVWAPPARHRSPSHRNCVRCPTCGDFFFQRRQASSYEIHQRRCRAHKNSDLQMDAKLPNLRGPAAFEDFTLMRRQATHGTMQMGTAALTRSRVKTWRTRVHRNTDDGGPSRQQLQPHFNMLANIGTDASEDDNEDDPQELPEIPLMTKVMPLDKSGPLAPYCPIHRGNSNSGWWGGRNAALNVAARESPNWSPVSSNTTSPGTNLSDPMQSVLSSIGVHVQKPDSPLRTRVQWLAAKSAAFASGSR